MKFREHRGGLEDSMATRVELADMEALVCHLTTIGYDIAGNVVLKEYAFDQRIMCRVFIVVDDIGVLGYVDEPVH